MLPCTQLWEFGLAELAEAVQNGNDAPDKISCSGS